MCILYIHLDSICIHAILIQQNIWQERKVKTFWGSYCGPSNQCCDFSLFNLQKSCGESGDFLPNSWTSLEFFPKSQLKQREHYSIHGYSVAPGAMIYHVESCKSVIMRYPCSIKGWLLEKGLVQAFFGEHSQQLSQNKLPKLIRDTPMTLICLSNHPCIGEFP